MDFRVDCASTTTVEALPAPASTDNKPSSGIDGGAIKFNSKASKRRPMDILIRFNEPDSSLTGGSFKTTAASFEEPTSTPPKWGLEPHTTSSPSNRPRSD